MNSTYISLGGRNEEARVIVSKKSVEFALTCRSEFDVAQRLSRPVRRQRVDDPFTHIVTLSKSTARSRISSNSSAGSSSKSRFLTGASGGRKGSKRTYPERNSKDRGDSDQRGSHTSVHPAPTNTHAHKNTKQQSNSSASSSLLEPCTNHA